MGSRLEATVHLAANQLGIVYVAGTSDIGRTGKIESYLVKYGPGLQRQWSAFVNADLNLDSTLPTWINDVATDAAGNAYIVGKTKTAAFVAAYDANGVHRWGHQVGTPTSSPDVATAAATDVSGNVYIVGQTGDDGPFLIKSSAAGVKQWTKQVATPFEAIATDRSGSVYAVGVGGLSKFTPEGDLTWNIAGMARPFWGNFSITVEADGSIYVANGASLTKFTSKGIERWRRETFSLTGTIVTAVAADRSSAISSVYMAGAETPDHDGKLLLTRFEGGTDTDGDGLFDLWETDGYTVKDVFIDLPTMGANPKKKDIFVEIDYSLSHHKPKAAAIQKVVAAFAWAPVGNPTEQTPTTDLDYSTGITLHVDYGPESIMKPVVHPTTGEVTGTPWGSLSAAEEIGFGDVVTFGSSTGPKEYNWSEFDLVKSDFFSKAREQSRSTMRCSPTACLIRFAQ